MKHPCMCNIILRNTVTISLPAELMKELDRAARNEGLTRSELVRESLRNSLFDRKFEELHAYGAARARRKGIRSEEKVFRTVS